MRRISITVLAACIGLTGSITLAGAELFSRTAKVIAILADDLFIGEAEGHLSGAGTLAIRSQKDPDLTCVGRFVSSDAEGGSGQMHCSDGAAATFDFRRLSLFSGHGVGRFSRGSMSFAYGLTAEEAGPYLKLPRGKKLAQNGAGLELVEPAGRTKP